MEANFETATMGTPISNRGSVEATHDAIVTRLMKLYVILQPHRSVHDFGEDILKQLRDSSLDEPAQIAVTVPPDAPDYSVQTYGIYMDKILQSCLYAVEALKSEESGDLEKAWAHISSAQYLLGFVEGCLILEPSIAHIITARSASGASKRDAKFDPIRKHALGLVHGKEHTFKSRNKAARELADQVLEFANKQPGVSMFATQMVNNLNRWFADIEFGPPK